MSLGATGRPRLIICLRVDLVLQSATTLLKCLRKLSLVARTPQLVPPHCWPCSLCLWGSQTASPTPPPGSAPDQLCDLVQVTHPL